MATAVDFRVVPIATVEVQKDFNNRRNLGDVSELADSIKSLGLLEPLIVWQPNGNGRLHLIAGERRLAAAKQAGLKEIPVIVRALDDKGRLEALLVENLHRKDIDPLEEADGYRRLIELGLKQKEIASKVGRSEAHVSKRLALSNLSPLTSKLVAAGTIPIESAIALAKYKPEHQDRAIKHVEKSYGKLADAAPYQLRNLGDRARDEAKKAAQQQKKAALIKGLKAKGVTLLSAQRSYHWGSPGHPARIGGKANKYENAIRVDLTPTAHSTFPCHAAAIQGGDLWTEPKVVYLCTDPTQHMDKEAAARYAKKAKENDRDPYEERQRKVDALRKELSQAASLREPAIRESLKAFDRQSLLKLALEAFVTSAGADGIVAVLGLEVTKGSAASTVLASYCNASEANLVRAAAAQAINLGEDAITNLALSHAGGYYFNRADLPHGIAVAEWFKQARIDLTEPEIKALEKAAKK